MYDTFLRSAMPGSDVRLRIDKPLAVPFADNPSIDIFRTADELERQTRAEKQDTTRQETRLQVVRPYAR